MNVSGSGRILLVGAALYLGLYALRFILILHRVLRLCWQRPSLAAADTVPTYLVDGLAPPIAELESLGFQLTGWLSSRAMVQSKYGTNCTAWLSHSAEGAFASVSFSDNWSPLSPYSVVFRTFLADGRCVRTFNGMLHNLLSQPSTETPDRDPYVPTITSHWQAHLTSTKRQRQLKPSDTSQIDPARALELVHAAWQKEYDDLLASGSLIPDGNAATLSWARAVRVTVRIIKGDRPMSRMRAAARRNQVKPPPLLPLEEEVRAYLRQEEVTAAPSRRNFYLWLFIATLLMFVISTVSYGSIEFAAALLAVLFLHESGHYLAMRALGYQDTTIFFIPFIGGVATGKKHDASASQEMLVLLAGPVPGLFLAMLLLLTHATRLPGIATLVSTLIGLNLFNLLPILPLDGGRILQTLLFARSPRLDLTARVLAVAVFGLFAFQTPNAVSIVLFVVMLAGLPTSRRIAALLRQARPALASLPPDAHLPHLLQLMRDNGQGSMPSTKKFPIVRAVLTHSAKTVSPGCLVTLGWLLVYGLVFVAAVVGIIAATRLGR